VLTHLISQIAYWDCTLYREIVLRCKDTQLIRIRPEFMLMHLVSGPLSNYVVWFYKTSCFLKKILCPHKSIINKI
jgi:hypothetical protein